MLHSLFYDGDFLPSYVQFYESVTCLQCNSDQCI